ncbi:MAG: DUF3365 domain-containing protein [Nitrospirae bacterium]|nr:DUF3365 domain-containing protein [Nitrospirota bacterium]
MKLQTRFTITFLSVLLLALAVLSAIAYKETRRSLEQEAYSICEKILAEVEATRQYVREVLRPKMYEIVKDDFVLEAMSTSFIARGQAERFLQRYPDYYIKFATENPRNPKNMADETEKKIIRFFRDNPEERKWRGTVYHNGAPYFTVATPYYFEKQCLKCHGDPGDAPASLLQTYGDKNGFGRKVGELTINTVGIPVMVSYSDVWQKTIIWIIPVLILACITFLLSTMLFRRLVTVPVDRLKQGVNSIADGEYDYRVEIKGRNEISELASSYNSMAENLKSHISRLQASELEREKLNTELKRRNFELEQILYAATHDLKTPLVNINGYTGELKKSMEDIVSRIEREDIFAEIRKEITLLANELPESFGFISMSISRMDTLLNGLLQFSRSGNADLKTEDIDMNMLISGILSNLNYRMKEAGADFEVTDLPRCTGDREQVIRIFSNLIENAVKYLDTARKGKIKVSGHKEGNLSVYCVEDNGIGIASEHQKQIFHIFHQLDPSKAGEGLGLVIVQRMVERHGGKIWVESEAGKGSRFFVALPHEAG